MPGIGIFSVRSGLGHGYEMPAHGDYSSINARPVMYIDLLSPVFLAVLLVLIQRKRNTDPARQAGNP